jgi:hypothetical protein
MAAIFLSIEGSASAAFSLAFEGLLCVEDAFFFAASQCKQRASSNTANNNKAGALMLTKLNAATSSRAVNHLHSPQIPTQKYRNNIYCKVGQILAKAWRCYYVHRGQCSDSLTFHFIAASQIFECLIGILGRTNVPERCQTAKKTTKRFHAGLIT